MQGIRSAAPLMVSLCAALLAGACSSTGEKQPTVRTTTETAPADLQLLCAAQGADKFGVNRDKALPLSSARETATSYRVVLNLDGSTANCVIDESGVVESLEMA